MSENENLERRVRWRRLVEEHPKKTKTELRKVAKSDYIWLYRNDSQWLEDNSPELLSRKKYVDNRVDWDHRDEELSSKASEFIKNELRGKAKPVRITISHIGKKIGHLSLLQEHMDKLPKTKAIIDAAFETVEDFQVRRVKWVAMQICINGDLLEEWKILRAAGLRPNYSKRVAAQIEYELVNRFRIS